MAKVIRLDMDVVVENKLELNYLVKLLENGGIPVMSANICKNVTTEYNQTEISNILNELKGV